MAAVRLAAAALGCWPSRGRRGCPALARIAAGAIELGEPIQFGIDSARILSESDGVLRAVPARSSSTGEGGVARRECSGLRSGASSWWLAAANPIVGVPLDAGADGAAADVGTPHRDAATDGAGHDAAAPDAGPPDAGGTDTGTPDGGQPDAGVIDGGELDAGEPDAGDADAAT